MALSEQNSLDQAIRGAFKNSRQRRFIIDKVIVSALSICALVVLFALFNIILELVINGASSVNLDFFIHLSKPVGEKGGGTENFGRRLRPGQFQPDACGAGLQGDCAGPPV